jgi:hypothetical protein
MFDGNGFKTSSSFLLLKEKEVKGIGGFLVG